LKDRELSSNVLLCTKDGEWKKDLEELLRLNQVVTLLSRGVVKYEVLNYLKAHPNIQILGMSTKYFKKREKGLGLSIKVKPKGKQYS